jgi:AraC-like DNA-binding protein
MEQLLHCMANENRAKSEFKVEILYSLLKVFLIRLIQQTAGAGPGCKRQPVKDDVVNRFIGMVYEHFSTMKKVADYAEILCIAPSYLNIRVKAVTGLTASSLIKQVIITEAKKQVWEKGLSLKEVAYQLGYDDTSHFSKFFKRAAGKNYSSFKRNLVDN